MNSKCDSEHGRLIVSLLGAHIRGCDQVGNILSGTELGRVKPKQGMDSLVGWTLVDGVKVSAV
jgi:hypothetical protein